MHSCPKNSIQFMPINFGNAYLSVKAPISVPKCQEPAGSNFGSHFFSKIPRPIHPWVQYFLSYLLQPDSKRQIHTKFSLDQLKLLLLTLNQLFDNPKVLFIKLKALPKTYLTKYKCCSQSNIQLIKALSNTHPICSHLFSFSFETKNQDIETIYAYKQVHICGKSIMLLQGLQHCLNISSLSNSKTTHSSWQKTNTMHNKRMHQRIKMK